MTADVETLVEKLKSTLIQSFEYCIPDKDNFFPPGLNDEQITQFEQEYKLKLPSDVKEYLRLLNGEGSVKYKDIDSTVGLFLGLEALGLEDIKREMKIWKQVWDENPEFADNDYESIPEGAVQGRYVDPDNWIGLAIDGSGNSIGVDLKPGPNGTYGQVIVWGRDYYDSRVVVFKNWTEYLTSVVKDVNDKIYTIDKEYNCFEVPESNYLDYVFEREYSKYNRANDQ